MPGTGDKLMTASEIKEVTDTKLVKDFSSLTALSGTPATGDLVPIKSGNDTYKIDYNALASAILGQITTNGVVNVANGGTGSNSATGALSGLIGALDTSSGFSLSDTIPVSINGTAYTITGRTLSNAIGGGGTEQSALTNYVKNCGTISSLPATIEDENITEDMVLLAYSLGTPSAMGSNWSVATDDGEIEITGTISGSTTLTLTFGVGYSVAPTILTDLSSTNPDNILKASPRPGVTGTLPVANGGTGAASVSAARTALDVYSKSEVTTAISQSTAKSTSTANVTIYTGNITAYVNKLLKCAGLVYAFLEVETTSGQTLTISDAFARIPSGWRPKVAEEFPASILQSDGTWATYKVSIGTNGDINQLLTNSAKGVSFVAVYEHV